MFNQTLGCLTRDADATRPLYAIRPRELIGWLDVLPPAQAKFVRQSGFVAAAQELALLLYLLPPVADITALYWVNLFRKYRGEVAGLMKRLRRRRLTVFWPD